MKKIIQKINNWFIGSSIKIHKNRWVFIGFAFSVSLVVLFMPMFVYAKDILGVGEAIVDSFNNVINSVLHWVIMGLAHFFAFLATMLMDYLVKVAAFNHFIDLEAVEVGWKLVRDFCNMFFIVLLMVIAVSTIIRVEAYNYKKMLPKLLIMAVLINFSKMFTGLLIDLSQVVTLTFVDAFKDAAGGNMIKGFGFDAIMTFARENTTKDISNTTVLAALMMALFAGVIVVIVVAILLIIFLMRIVAFWILIILSPFAYLLSASGGIGSKYADQWWSEFAKYLIVGPVLAFFLWLSLGIMGKVQGISQQDLGAMFLEDKLEASGSWGITKFLESDVFMNFLISVAMLIGSLVAAQQIGAAGASAAGSALGAIKKDAMAPLGAVRWGRGKFIRWTGRTADNFIGRGITRGAAATLLGTSKLVDKVTFGLAGKTLGKSKRIRDIGNALKQVRDKKGIALRTMPKAWEAEFQRKEAERTMQSEGLARELFSRALYGETTNTVFKAEQQLVNEQAKTMSDVSTDSAFVRDQFFKAYDDENYTQMAAALKLLYEENNHNDLLVDERILKDDKYKDLRDSLQGVGTAFEDEDKSKLGVDALHMSRLFAHIQGKTKVSDSTMGGMVYTLQEIATGKGNLAFYGMSDVDPDTGEFKWSNMQQEMEYYMEKKGMTVDQAKKKMEEEHAGRIKGKTSNINIRNLVSKLHPTAIATEVVKKNDDGTFTTSYKFGDTEAQRQILKLIAGAGWYMESMRGDTKNAFTGFRHIDDLRDYLVEKKAADPDYSYQKWEKEELGPKFRALFGNEVYKDNFEPMMSKYVSPAFAGAEVPGPEPRKARGGRASGEPSSTEREATEYMSDIDQEKYQRTKDKAKEYADKGKDFYTSSEYLDNQDQYYEEGTMQRAKRSKARLEESKQEDLVDAKTGWKNVDVMSGINTAKSKGQKGETASLAINADNEDLKGLIAEGAAGVHLTGKKKEEAIKRLGDFYQKQLKAQNDQLADAEKMSDEQINAEVESLISSLRQADSLNLVNKNRAGFDARSILRHEQAHNSINNADQNKLKAIWDKMDPAKKAEVEQRIRSEWTDGDKMSDEQVMKEYFAEGAANFGRKDTGGGIQLDADEARALRAAGVRFKGAPKAEERKVYSKISKREMKREAAAKPKKESREGREKEQERIRKEREVEVYLYQKDVENKTKRLKQAETHRQNKEIELKENKAKVKEEERIRKKE
jgi:hypothetical protein